MILGPSLLYKYREYKRKKEIERRFTDFLRDVVQNTRAGMSLPQSIKSTTKNDYGPLTPYVKTMGYQIDWGLPFEEILEKFANNVESQVLRRTVSTIRETHRSGGNISDVLEAVSESILQIEKIRKERKSQIYGQILTGYTIFFVFLGIIVGLQLFLIPSFTRTTGLGGVMEKAKVEDLQSLYRTMFEHLIVIQGVFSGLAIGKMAEGSIVGGLKHSVALTAIGYSVFILAPAVI